MTLFLYLEVLDAAFSFDGVTGAFAITSDPIIIALGLGLVGSMFVRSITIYLVRQDTLDRYVYLEHGAHWAIGALAVIMLISIEPRDSRFPRCITASVGVVFIAAAFAWSVLAQSTASAGPGGRRAGQCPSALNRSTERCTSASASARPTQSAALTNLPGSSSL